jgi:hypothetical protein
MNIETLKSLTGWKRPTINPTPTDLEIALARVNADHKSVLIAVKMLTEIAQSNAAANLDMAVVHEERNKGSLQRDADLLKSVRELKREVSAAESRHQTTFEIALIPMTRAINDLMDKVNGLDGDINDLRAEIYADREAQASIQNTKLNAIAIRIDALTKLLAKDLIKHPKGVTVAPPKPKKKPGRRLGDKSRTPEERYKFLSHRLQVARPNSKARAKYMATLVKLRAKMGMAPMSDRALGKEAK